MSKPQKSARLSRWALMLSTALAGGFATGAFAEVPGGGVPVPATPTNGLTEAVIQYSGANFNNSQFVTVSIPDPGPTVGSVASIIDWTSFNLSNSSNGILFRSDNTVIPIAVLNRVTGTESRINGQINTQSNFEIWITNGAGILMGPNASFSGGGLMLSTAGFKTATVNDDAKFVNAFNGGNGGAYMLSGASSSASIIIQDGGLTGGTINAPLGFIAVAQQIDVSKPIKSDKVVALVAAQDVTLNYSRGNPVLGIRITRGTDVGAYINTSGAIEGGEVKLVAASQTGSIASLLNVNSGSLKATAVGGRVVLATKSDEFSSVDIQNSVGSGDGITVGTLTAISGHTGAGDGGIARFVASGNLIQQTNITMKGSVYADAGRISGNGRYASETSSVTLFGANGLAIDQVNTKAGSIDVRGGTGALTANALFGQQNVNVRGSSVTIGTGAFANNGSLTVNATGGDALVVAGSSHTGVRIEATGNVTAGAGGSTVASTLGNVTLLAGQGMSATVGKVGDNLVVIGGTVSLLTDQPVTNDLSVSTTLDPGGHIQINGTGALTAGRDVRINTAGTFTSAGSGRVNLSGQTLFVRAGGGTLLGNLTAGTTDVGSSAGDIDVNGTISGTVVDLRAGGTLRVRTNALNARTLAGRVIDVQTNGQLTITGPVTATRDLNLRSFGSINALGAVSSAVGPVTMDADGSLTANGVVSGGSLSLRALGGTSTLTGDYRAFGGDVFLSGATGIAGSARAFASNDVVMLANSGTITFADATAAARVRIGATIPAFPNSNSSVAATGNLSGAQGVLVSGRMVSVGDVTSTAGLAILQATTGNLSAGTVRGAVGTQFTAPGGNITATSAQSSGGDVVLTSVFGGTVGDIRLASAQAGGNLTIDGRDVVASGQLGASGSVNVIGRSVEVGGVSALASNVSLTARTGNLTVNGSAQSTSGDVRLTASSGAVRSVGASAGNDLVIQGASVAMTGLHYAGRAIAIQSDTNIAPAGSTAASLAGGGLVTVSARDNIALASANSRNSDVSIVSSTGIVSGVGGTTMDVSSNTRSVSVRGSDLILGRATAGTTLSLTATGRVGLRDGSAGTNATITATDVAITNGLGAGSAATVTASNNVQIAAIQSGAPGLSVSGASVDITAAGATGGPVDVRASAGNLRVGSVNAGTTAIIRKSGAAGGLTIGTLLANAGSQIVSSTDVALTNAAVINGALLLTASGAITGSPTITTTGATSNIDIVAGGSATLGTVNAGRNLSISGTSISATGLAAQAGSLLVSASGPITVTGATSAGTVVDLNANSTSEIRLTTVNAGGNLFVRGGSATRAASLTSGAAINVTTGALTGVAGASTGTTDTGFGRVSLTGTDAASVIQVTASTGLVQTGAVSAPRGIALTGNGIDVTSVMTTNGTASLTANTGNALLGTAGNSIRVIMSAPVGAVRFGGTSGAAPSLILSGRSVSINGPTSAFDLLATATAGDFTLNAPFTATSDVSVIASGNLSLLGSLSGRDVDLRSTGGAVLASTVPLTARFGLVITAPGQVALADATSTSGGITVTGGTVTANLVDAFGGANVRATAGNASVTTMRGGFSATIQSDTANAIAGRINSASGPVTVRANTATGTASVGANSGATTGAYFVTGRDVVLNGAQSAGTTFDAVATLGDLVATGAPLSSGGNMTISGNRSVTMDSATVNSGSLLVSSALGPVNATTLTRTTGAAGLTVSGTSVTLARADAAGGPADISATNGSATISGEVRGALGALVQSSNANATVGSINSSAGATTLRALGGLATSGGSSGFSVAIEAREISITGAQDATNGALSARAIGGALNATAALSATGAMTLSGSTGVSLTSTANSGGAMSVTSGTALSATGLLSSAAAMTLAGDTGVTLSGGATSGGLLSITSSAGNISSTGATGLTANGGALTLAASNGTITSNATSASGNTSITAKIIDLTGLLNTAGGTFTASATAGDLTSIAAGTIRGTGNVDLRASNSLRIADVTSTTGSLLLNSVGQMTVGAASAGTTATIDKTGTATTTGELQIASLTTGNATATTVGTATINSGTNARIGSVNAKNGTLTINARNGAVSGLMGGRANLTSTGGTSDILINEGNPVPAAASSALLGTVSAGRDVKVTAGSIDATGITANAGLVSLTTPGALNLGTVASNGNLTLSAASVSAGTLTSTAGALSVTATTGNATVATAAGRTGATIQANNGNVAVTTSVTSGAGAVSLLAPNGSVTSAGTTGATNVTMTAGSISLTGAQTATTGTFNASATTGALGATGLLQSGGAMTLAGATGVTLSGGATSANALTITSSGGNISSTGATGLSANGGALSLSAVGGTIASNTTNASTSIEMTARNIALTGTQTATSGTFKATATGTPASLSPANGNITADGAITAGSDVTLSATGATTLAAISVGTGKKITIGSAGIQLSGALSAPGGAISLTNSGTGATTIGGTTETGYALREVEINFLKAPSVTISSGTNGINFGAVALAADVGTTNLRFLTRGDIVLRGAITQVGTPARTVQFGGIESEATPLASGSNTTPTLASSIFAFADRTLAAGTTVNPNSGSIILPTATIDLRANRIAFGLADFITGNGDLAAASASVSNANSALYSSRFQAGTPVYDPNVELVRASLLQVSYSQYALFQNTAPLSGGTGEGLLAGVRLGTATPNTTTVALQLFSSGPAVNSNAFALFGTINGFVQREAATVGAQVIQIQGSAGTLRIATDTSRVNGCLVGQSEGCLVTSSVQSIIRLFDERQAQVFGSTDNPNIPFDPLVGTNNESLIGDIASGLSTPDNCDTDETGACRPEGDK